MYAFILGVHNIMRWVALILGLIAFVRSLWGWLGRRNWSNTERISALLFTSAMDLQLLLGLILYFFLSPLTRSIFQDPASAMSNPGVRFFGLEHALYMFFAVVFSHLGSAFSRKASADRAKFQRAALWFGLALLLILLGMPWSRRLFPGL